MINGFISANLAGASANTSLYGTSPIQAGIHVGYTIMPIAAIISNIALNLDSAAGAGQTATVAIRVNGVDSGVSVTVSGATPN